MNKVFLSLAMLGALVFGGCGGQQSGLELELNLTVEENFEGGGRQREVLRMQGNSGYYSYEFTDSERDESFELSAEETESLKLFVQALGLNQDLVEEQDNQQEGTRVQMNLLVWIDGKETQMTIVGMSALGADGEAGGNIENFASVEAAQELISAVKELKGL
ncbi:MAG: hypothetical protein WC777_01660 [Candidatus Gracilibacteria bacterium]|jgi:hypothetical protein